MPKIRYFKDSTSVWRFAEDMAPLIKCPFSAGWSPSIFSSLEDFLGNSTGVVEIAKKEGEAKTWEDRNFESELRQDRETDEMALNGVGGKNFDE